MYNFTESEIESFSIEELKQLGFFYMPAWRVCGMFVIQKLGNCNV